MMNPVPENEFLPEVSRIPLVDAHCHPIKPTEGPLTVRDFDRLNSLTFMEHNRPKVSNWPDDSFPRPTIMLNYLYRQLAEFLGVPPDPARIVQAREERARDFGAYVRSLMDDAGIEQLVADSGFPGPRPVFEGFREVAGRPVWELVRIDRVMFELAEEHDEFGRFLAALCARLEGALQREDCVGLKSEIAYLTGLEIDKGMDKGMDEGAQDVAAASALYPAFRENPGARDYKPLRDYCFRLGLQLCMEYGKPMQVHCGFGSDDIRLARTAPRHLYELLAFPPYCDCVVVLVHGGYPMVKEAAYMTNVLPNVFLDFSETCPVTAHGVEDALWDILQLAPVGKVMYGSDGFLLPELFWLAAKLGRGAVRGVLARLAGMGFVDESDALKIARLILHDNAVGVYRL